MSEERRFRGVRYIMEINIQRETDRKIEKEINRWNSDMKVASVQEVRGQVLCKCKL